MNAERLIRYSGSLARSIGPLLLLLATVVSPSFAQDGIGLTVQRGPGADEVTLQWTGGGSPWEIFSSSDPASVDDPVSMLGETNDNSWTDSPPIAPAVFYRVNSCELPADPDPHACGFSCFCCDPWFLSWEPVPCAGYYVVTWQCSIFPEQVWDVGNVTSINDVCVDIDMCNGMCNVGSVNYIRVQACNASGCSSAIDVPADEIPLTCGGGCCC